MGRGPESGDEAAYFTLAVTGQEHAQVQFTEMNARPQQGDRQQAEQQARVGGRVSGIAPQHRGICTAKGVTAIAGDCSCSLA
ncbi:hypothetical protein D3C75_1204050 [compost metagenome]